MLRKALLLVFATTLLASWDPLHVTLLSVPAFADDDDDDDDRRRPGVRFGRNLPGFVIRRAPARTRPTARLEIVAAGLSPDDLDRLQTQGFTLLRTQQIGLLGSSLARLQIPPRLDLRRALAVAARTAPNATFASNDLYRRQPHVSYRPSGGGCGERCEAFEITAWTQSIGRCGTNVTIGLIDTGADLAHASLAGSRVTTRTIRSPDRSPSDKEHGTAVLSLLVGKTSSEVVGIVPGAHVFLADAFHGGGEGSRADVFDLVAAIDWLASEGVRVVNLSLSGPHNVHVERAIAAAQSKSVLVVAASGRPGRGQASGYPARYGGVIAVSAVDGRLRPSRLANRGDHISFAAPGAGIAVAQSPFGVRRVEGTSFAAPFVTAAYAMGLGRNQKGPELTELLARSAKDLGSPGRDPVYGWGLLQFTALPPC